MEYKYECKHGKIFCCLCKYGNFGQQRSEDNPRDLVDDLKTPVGYKIEKGLGMSQASNFDVEFDTD